MASFNHWNSSLRRMATTFLCIWMLVAAAAQAIDPTNPTPTSNATTTVNADVKSTVPTITSSRPLLGQNGTGQRWATLTPLGDAIKTTKPTVVSEPISPAVAVNKPLLGAAAGRSAASESTSATESSTSTMTSTSSPSTVPSTAAAPAMPPKFDPPSSSSWEDEYINVDNVDTEKDELTDEELRQRNLTLGHEEHHIYYNSTTSQNAEQAQEFLRAFQNLTPNAMLSKSHRRAMTYKLKFEFPFYGNLIQNVTVATGGFIYTGDYVHSWLAATQYIAPLMANFDTSLSNDSYVKYYDNGTSFTVLWENVHLQEHVLPRGFTFSATLHKNGDIVFGYYDIPISIDGIEDKKHPVKVGLSDAYISDKTVYYARRKTIYEYHRLTFGAPIRNNTMIVLKPEPTCNTMETCADCTNLATFKCGWCPTMNRCSTGTDRKRHLWLLKGCDKSQVSKLSECPNPEVPVRPSSIMTSDVEASAASSRNSAHDDDDPFADEAKASGGVGTAMGIMIVFGLVVLASGWVVYAYRNPHTKSGQLLIQYRPSQWSWRRGEARYTAATIHM